MLYLFHFAVGMLGAGPIHAAADVADICNLASRAASETTDVPVELLLALTLTETGKNRSGEMKTLALDRKFGWQGALV